MSMPTHERIQQRLETVLTALSPGKLEQVVDFAEYLKSREEWEVTLELMNDPAMREDVEEGRAQAARGEGRRWREVQARKEIQRIKCQNVRLVAGDWRLVLQAPSLKPLSGI